MKSSLITVELPKFYRIIVLTLLLLPGLCNGQQILKHEKSASGATFVTTSGILQISLLTESSVRVRFTKKNLKPDSSLILTASVTPPPFKITENNSDVWIKTPKITVAVHKDDGRISFSDGFGKRFLSEKAWGRKLTESTAMGQPSYIADQSFESPDDEAIFGTGQFQDGHLNVKGLPRKLVQVNSQIAIPFIYSSKGYGLLWHQYGLTEFNPADNKIALQEVKNEAPVNTTSVDVTTTEGTKKVMQGEKQYTGSFTVPADGKYALMLDLGEMTNRHEVTIDGVEVIKQTNYWLPPAVGELTTLKAGKHEVKIICKLKDQPVLTWRSADDRATTFRSPAADAIDYVVFYGQNADEVFGQYDKLCGGIPMIPLWSFGFWQCRERYSSSQDLINTGNEFRKRKIPVDVIVQDWQYWGKNGWGAMKFDEQFYPDPAGLMKDLHQLHLNFSLSVWENVDQKSAVGKNYLSHNLFIPGTPWIDLLNPEGRKLHWDAMNKNLNALGVDSWWLDATEPENDALAGHTTYLGPGDKYRLTYPLFVSKTVYEGQRAASPEKRVSILTRSAFAGQQRYGTINWSGDIGSTWDAYVRQIPAGLNYTATGMPFWTTDIGGFFRPEKTQYGDPAYQELLVRWFQWGTFNPVMRIHGYKTETEIWKFGKDAESDMREMLGLRYRLLPYIYSAAWQVTKGALIMRPLVMDFANDQDALKQTYEYLFGHDILVAPVTKPDVKVQDVYLPKGIDWYNFWTGERFQGGKTVHTPAPRSIIPLYVKAGAIIPMGKFMQYTSELKADTIEIRIYKGRNGHFNLYEDEGNGYNYEKGKYSIISFDWDESRQTLTIGKKKGNFEGSLNKRVFNIIWVKSKTGVGIPESKLAKIIKYDGEKLLVKNN